MTAFDDGGRRFRASRGQLRDDERDDLNTETPMQRGRLRLRASRGDVEAKRALRAWAQAEQDKRLLEEGGSDA